MSTATACATITCFEHPLSEHIRLCLQLEALFKQFYHHLDSCHDDTLNALLTLLKIINATDRPDIKSKLTQTLNQYALSLNQLKNFSQIDTYRLNMIIDQLDHSAQKVNSGLGKISEKFKQNQFINQLRLMLNTPSGLCLSASNPLKTWVSHPKEYKLRYLHHWSSQLKHLGAASELILGLIRQSKESKNHVADEGFFQKNLNPNLPCDMLIVKVSAQDEVYPEISAGKHRLSIRFMSPNFYHEGYSSQTKNNIAFQLTCCQL